MRINNDVVNHFDKFPMIIMGGAVQDFKKSYHGPIVRCSSVEEVREFVSYYSGIRSLDRVLVMEDLSFLPEMCEGLMLKFVEETKLNLIILSLFDKVSSVMLSRMKEVIKYSLFEVKSEFLKPSVGDQKLNDSLQEGSSHYDRVRYMGTISPRLYYLDHMVKRRRSKSKIISFVD